MTWTGFTNRGRTGCKFGIDFWYMECSNIIQDRSTSICALSVKGIQTRHNGITGNKKAGQRHKGYEITHNFYSSKGEGTREIGVIFVVERNMKRNAFDFKVVVDRI